MRNFQVIQLFQMVANVNHFAMPGQSIATQESTEVSGLIHAFHALLDITVGVLIQKNLSSAQRVLILSEGKVVAHIVILDITKIKQGHHIVSFAQLGIIVQKRD
jgi:hypothetical protein